MNNNKVFSMKLSKICPLLVLKAEKKTRIKEEVDEIICWLAGYNESGLEKQLRDNADYETFLMKLYI